MNKLILSGRPTRNPEIIYTGGGENQKAIAKFTLASNRIFKRENEPLADFIPCVAFGRQAKFIEQYVKKGMLIQITGPLRNNDYTNKDGQKVYSFQVVVESIEIMEKKGSGHDVNSATDAEGYMTMTEEEMAEMPFK